MLLKRRRKPDPPKDPDGYREELERLMEMTGRLQSGLNRLQKWEDEAALADLRRKARTA